MEKVSISLCVFFEAPFWIGICERSGDKDYEVCKITFGAEPKGKEIGNFILENWNGLKFSPSIPIPGSLCGELKQPAPGSFRGEPSIQEGKPGVRHGNPKRIRRKIEKELLNAGIGTKAQQALKLQQEQGKVSRKIRSRKQREYEKERKFQLQQSKRKEKHRGH